MHGYLAEVLREHDCETLVVGGVEDHVHALFALSRNYSIATIVKEIKRTSSSWIKEASPRQAKFHWQNGYGAFSVSKSNLSRVVSSLRLRATSPALYVSRRVSSVSEKAGD
jgi:REP element-mobilizing transposase RayT